MRCSLTIIEPLHSARPRVIARYRPRRAQRKLVMKQLPAGAVTAVQPRYHANEYRNIQRAELRRDRAAENTGFSHLAQDSATYRRTVLRHLSLSCRLGPDRSFLL